MAVPITILVVGDEDIFIKFLGQFSPKRYAVQFANDTAKAKVRFWAKQPKLVVVCADQVPKDLATLLKDARDKKVSVLGIYKDSAGALAKHTDRAVPAAELGTALVAANELLQERRSHPRVTVELPVTLEGSGPAVAKVVSAQSLFVATDKPLKPGTKVKLTIEADAKSLHCQTKVGRVGDGESGHHGMVLEITEDAPEVRSYLEGLVRWIMVLEHYQRRPGDESTLLPEPITQMLAQRALQLLLSDDKLPEKVLQRHSPPGLVDKLKKTGPPDDDYKKLSAQLSEQRKQIQTLKDQLEEMSWSAGAEAPATGGKQPAAPAAKDSDRIAALHKRVEQLQKGLQSQSEALKNTERALRRSLEKKAAKSEEIREQVVQALHEQEQRLSEVTMELEQVRSGPLDLIRPPKGDVLFPKTGGAEAAAGDEEEDGPTERHDVDALVRAKTPPPSVEQAPQGGEPAPEFEEDAPTRRVDPDSVLVPDSLVPPEELKEQSGLEFEAAGMNAEEVTGDSSVPVLEATRPTADLPWAFPESRVGDTGDYTGSNYEDEGETSKISDADLKELKKDLHDGKDLPPDKDLSKDVQPTTPAEGPHEVVVPVAADAPELVDASQAKQPAAAQLLGQDPYPFPSQPQVVDEIVEMPKRGLGIGVIIAAGVGIALILGVAIFFLVRALDKEPAETPEPDKKQAAGPQQPAEGTDTGAAVAQTAVDAAGTAAQGPADATAPAIDQLSPDSPAEVAKPVPVPKKKLSRRQLRRLRLALKRAKMRALLKRANRLIRKKNHAEARKLLTDALKISDDYRVRQLMGRSHDAAGEMWPAAYHYQKAAASAPGRLKPRLYDRLGLIYTRVKKKAKACKAFKQALQHKPDFEPAVKHHAKFCK